MFHITKKEKRRLSETTQVPQETRPSPPTASIAPEDFVPSGFAFSNTEVEGSRKETNRKKGMKKRNAGAEALTDGHVRRDANRHPHTHTEKQERIQEFQAK